MTIERQTTPYEYLVRFADGTVRGQHLKYLTRVVDTETSEVLTEREGEAIPVGDVRGGVMLESALGEVGAALARAEEVERGRRTAAEQQRDAVTAERDQARAERDAARAEVERLTRGRPASGAEVAKVRE